MTDLQANWRNLETEYLQATQSVGRIPSENELDVFKISLKYPSLLTSKIVEKFDRGLLIPVLPSKADLIEHATGLLLSRSRVDTVPTIMLGELTDHLKIIEEGIARETADAAFAVSWGVMQFALGIIAASETDDTAIRNFRGAYKKAAPKDTTLQQYWYARWLKANGSTENDRRALDDELSEICSGIARGTIKPIKFGKAWFVKMLPKKFSDSARLTTTYTRLSVRQINRMAANMLVPDTILPPLTLTGFGIDNVP